MNEATRAKRRNLTAAVSEYRLRVFCLSPEQRKLLLREVAAVYGVTQKAILEKESE